MRARSRSSTRALGDIFGEQDVDELFEAGFKTMRAFFVGVSDDGHAGDFVVFRWADSERIDVDGQAPRQRRDAVEDAGLVFNVSDSVCMLSSVFPCRITAR